MPRLTILICTHDWVGLLERALAALNAARRPAIWTVDVLVATNACSDSTAAFLDTYRLQSAERGWLPLTWFAEPTPGKSNALNSALPRITGDLVAFVDDGHRVDIGYLETMCTAVDAHPQATTASCPTLGGNEPAWVHDKGPYRIFGRPQRRGLDGQ